MKKLLIFETKQLNARKDSYSELRKTQRKSTQVRVLACVLMCLCAPHTLCLFILSLRLFNYVACLHDARHRRCSSVSVNFNSKLRYYCCGYCCCCCCCCYNVLGFVFFLSKRKLQEHYKVKN